MHGKSSFKILGTVSTEWVSLSHHHKVKKKTKNPKSNHPKSRHVCGPKLLRLGHMISSTTVGVCLARNAHFRSFITKTFPVSHVYIGLYADFTMPNFLLIF